MSALDDFKKAFTLSLRNYDGLKRAAGIFAGLGHLQPLLLATTNSNYLLDRFCMERCCSSEYISRIVTSIIFMEILSIIVVRIAMVIAPTGLRYILHIENPNTEATNLNSWNENEEWYRGILGSIILFIIFLGYLQILIAFTTGGRKGHMHWFYSSLLIQHFLNSLIAGSIGFWEVGLALWYLVTLPMAPIIVFFYQMIIHSWIRKNGPRDAEYLVVEWQIWLAITISCIATVFWAAGYVIPYIPTKQPTTQQLTPAQLDLGLDSPGTNITNLKVYTVTRGSETAEATISAKSGSVPVTIHSITVTLSGGIAPVIVRPNKEVTLGTSTAGPKIKVDTTQSNVTVKIENGNPDVTLYDGPGAEVKIALAGSDLNSITGGSAQAEVKGYTCYPDPDYYYYNSVSTNPWKEEWDGGKCFYAEYYETGGDPALLMLHVLGNTLTTKYYGKATGNWKKIDKAKFSECVDELQRTGTFTDPGGEDARDPSYNFEYSMVFGPPNKLTPTWLPLIMQGLSVGAVGSIFPNLIPRTLVCPKTTRTLSVMNMFLVTVPHIFNVMLGDNDVNPASKPWDDTGHAWTCSLLLYLFYILAILFAIFNIHYPEWRLSSFLRNNTWMVFLMILFTDVLNESFNAISRAGICSQRSANQTPNHPCLHNKIACLMNLMYIPFWMTTTP